MYTPAARRRVFAIAILLAFCLLLPACAGKRTVTQANYDQIKNDMTLKEVEAILGPGTKDESGDGSGAAAQFGINIGGPERSRGETYIWESRSKTIKVHFAGGKVTNKQKEGF